MALEWLSCERCREVTPHRSIIVQIYGPGGKHRFEKAFLLCTCCLQEGRDALTHVVEDYYFLAGGARPNSTLEAMVVAAITSTEGETFGLVASRVRAARKSMATTTATTEPELERVLEGMTRSGLVYRRKLDRTQRVIRWLEEGRQKPSSPCRRCGGLRVVGLYAAFRRTESQSKVRVGFYCLSCKSHSLDKGKLLGKPADRRGGKRESETSSASTEDIMIRNTGEGGLNGAGRERWLPGGGSRHEGV